MLKFINFKSPSSPLHTPNHPAAPPGTPEHHENPEHPDDPEHLHPEHPNHPEHSHHPEHPHHSYRPPLHFDAPSHPNLRPIIPQTQQHQTDSYPDTHPILLPLQPNTQTAEPKTITTHSLTNPFHVSLILENRGSVARDHLALERTYLAYVRTSLAIASAGVALVQLFTISSKNTGVQFSGSQFARPLGATMIVYGLTVLTMGTFRYFRVQHTLPRGFFPTTLHGIAASAFILGTFMTVLFGILVGAKT